ncbi:SOS response-associated peptidase [Flavobacteriaceae bacterium F89]|uniref:Abasic site processing protein n=1 Tax=Cerina litoralis TaxID=2874477 RepID=A0AAE3ESC1_9FLAO|nr:SOS response-associated peptidase [Cerina litoralis]MCG2459475.1 SOS response-associated peptidase [Cerina litoralis]
MCYRTRLNAELEEVEKSFDAHFLEKERYAPKEEINAFSYAPYPIITDENSKEILFYEWGLIPFWSKDDSIKKYTLNAKIETLDKKPSYRNSVNKRCLVIADGFYEWQWLDAKGKEKQKYLIRPKGQEVFAFAGIYSQWTDPETEKEIGTFSIVTTEANELMSEIHNNKKRMPIVLREKDRGNWLSDMDYSDFAFPYETELVAKKC